jgi:magnesium transporter
MVTYYLSAKHGLERLAAAREDCWIDAVNPTPEEIDGLAALGAPAHLLRHALDLGERPRIDHEDGATLVVLRLPYARGAAAPVPYLTVPLGVILLKAHIITVCRVEEDLAQLALGHQRDKVSTSRPNRFLLLLFLSVAERFLADLDAINAAVEGLEDRLERSLQNREVLRLLRYQKSLTHFTTALHANRLMFERLQRSHLFEGQAEDLELLEEVLTENEQAIETANISSDLLSQLMDAFASIISNNLNVVMKFLAVMTVVLTVPTLIASYYGMNMALPAADQPWAFYAVLGGSLLAAAGIWAYFRRKDWL